MGAPFHEVLDAAIRHLQELKDRGTRFINVTHENLAGLAAENPVRPAKPTSPVMISQPKPTVSPLPTAVPRQAPDAKAQAEANVQAMAELRERAMQCVKCPHLAGSRKNVVFGVGNIDAQIMFVGEAPGADEDLQGEPFVGKAGQLLTKIIETMGVRRNQAYIANILKCRPDTPGQSAGN